MNFDEIFDAFLLMHFTGIVPKMKILSSYSYSSGYKFISSAENKVF